MLAQPFRHSCHWWRCKNIGPKFARSGDLGYGGVSTPETIRVSCLFLVLEMKICWLLSRTIKVSQAVVKDFPDLELSTGLEVIAGLLYVPLSSGGKDFIAFLRKGQPRDVHWAGRPRKDSGSLAPRKSFKIWSEIVAGRCRAWTDDQMETAAILSLVYGKVRDTADFYFSWFL